MRALCIAVSFCLSLTALEKQPWFGEVYEFHLHTGYTYSFFRKVQGAVNQLNQTSNDHLLFSDLEFSLSPYWSIDTELEFTDTPRQSFSFRSYALQSRYLWYDDIVGDLVTLSSGFNGRFVSSRSLKDVSCPYHGNVDIQGNISIGKEFDQGGCWRYRLWGFGEVGIANRGSPWIYGLIALEGNFLNQHKWGFFLIGGHGYGRKTSINIDSFKGYGKIRYKFVDIAVRYGMKIGVWGTLRFEYQRRLLAKLYPERINFFTISFLLPFSF